MPSPTPKARPSSVAAPAASPTLLTFAQALEAVVEGHHVTRQGWDQPGTVILLQGEQLSIRIDGTVRTFIVVSGDITARDWRVVTH